MLVFFIISRILLLVASGNIDIGTRTKCVLQRVQHKDMFPL